MAPALSGYANENDLQEILFQHPTLLPGVVEPATACREFQSGAGPADVVVLHGMGELAITECKLAQNPQVRREVVGQIVDYASRIWRMPLGDFEARWRQRTGESPFDTFGDAAESVRERLSERLASGRFTVVLAVDGINDELRRMIEYLNAVTVSDVQVLAFEVARVRDGDVEILIPRVFGAELAQAKTSTRPQPSWNEADFFDWLAENAPQVESAMRLLVDEVKRRGLLIANGTAASPSLILGSNSGDAPVWPVSLFTEGANRLSAQFRLERFVDRGLDPQPAAALLSRFPAADVNLAGLRDVGYRKWIKIPFEALTEPDMRQLLLDALQSAASGAS